MDVVTPFIPVADFLRDGADHHFTQQFIENTVEPHMLANRSDSLHGTGTAGHAGKQLGDIFELPGFKNMVVNPNLVCREILTRHIRHLGVFFVLAHFVFSPSNFVRQIV